jgi:hypothetical protein
VVTRERLAAFVATISDLHESAEQTVFFTSQHRLRRPCHNQFPGGLAGVTIAFGFSRFHSHAICHIQETIDAGCMD